MERRWTIEVKAIVRAATPAVVEWWSDPERKNDLIDDLLRRGLTDCSIDDSVVGPLRVRELRWATQTGSRMYQKIESTLGRSGRPGDWDGECFRILIHEVNQVRFRDGREETVDCDQTLEFVPRGSGSTAVVNRHAHLTANARWYERLLPPNNARVQMQRQLRIWAARCEDALRSTTRA